MRVLFSGFTSIGWKFYLVFICLDVVSFILVWKIFPEVSQNTAIWGVKSFQRAKK